MPGWNLKYGELVADHVSADEYWSLFNYVFSDSCKKTNTYKFGIIKSICDQIYNLSIDAQNTYFLSYELLFSKFTENYWNLVNKYQLKQMLFNGKSEYSKIELIIKQSVKDNSIPDNVQFENLREEDKKRIIQIVTSDCKRCVVGALYNDFSGKLYAFDLRGEGIYLSHSAYEFISKYKIEIERLNYYSWARFLEKTNDDNTLIRVLEKLDLSTPRRKDLSIYRELLYKEFQENKCFYCGTTLNKKIHVDHFIPWSFVKSDNLWNFVLSCPKCNIRKNDNLVSHNYVTRLEKRNKHILDDDRDRKIQSFIIKEFNGYYSGLLSNMWKYAQMSGYKEITY